MSKIHLYKEKVKKDNRQWHLNSNKVWIIQIILMSFFLSLSLSFFSETVIPHVPILISTLILILFIALGIIFDMVGVSATVADKKIFNSMAAKKINGSKTALYFIKNNSKVSSFCNDVIGDICGIISGGAGVTISQSIANTYGINIIIINLFITSLIAAITIGGKAIGKSHAINKSNQILYSFARIINIMTFNKSK